MKPTSSKKTETAKKETETAKIETEKPAEEKAAVEEKPVVSEKPAETTPPAEKTKSQEVVPGARLIVEEKDGTRIDRPMSTVRRVLVEGGTIVIVLKTGRIERIPHVRRGEDVDRATTVIRPAICKTSQCPPEQRPNFIGRFSLAQAFTPG